MSLRVYLVDDEAPARGELRFLLGELDGVEVVGDAGTPSQAVREIRALQPDVALLDVQLPGMDGLELAEVLRALPRPPAILFATAHERYAVDAFEQEALDYVLKPFTLERLERAVRRAERLLAGARAAGAGAQPVASAPAAAEPVRRVLVQLRGRILPIAPEQVIHASADDGETRLVTADGTFTTRATLAALEERLVPLGFARVHRSALVNLRCIAELIPWFNGAVKLVMTDPGRSEILVSRYHVRALKDRLQLVR